MKKILLPLLFCLHFFAPQADAQTKIDCSKLSSSELRKIEDKDQSCAKKYLYPEQTAGSRIAEAKQKAKNIIKDTFKDPDSVKFRNLRVTLNGRIVCGEVNAKNSYGGYTGFELFYSRWESGTVHLIEKDAFQFDEYYFHCVSGKHISIQ